MQTHTVRISAADHATLAELAKATGKSMSSVPSEAVQEMQRRLLLRQTNEAYRWLRKDGEA